MAGTEVLVSDLLAMFKRLGDPYLREGREVLQNAPRETEVQTLSSGSVHSIEGSVKAFLVEEEAEWWRGQCLVGRELPRGLCHMGQCWSQA